jgi:hypothetical protein
LIVIKEEFLASVKTKRAYKLGGGDAILLWLALRGYVATSNTGGFIPDDAIEDLPLIPKQWKKAMRALTECGKKREDGERGPGLVVQSAHGYQLHDYDDHGTPVEVEELRRKKAREQKAARRALLRHQQGTCREDCPHCGTGQSGGQHPDSPADTSGGQETGQSGGPPPRASGHGRVGAHARAGSPAQPSPTQPEGSDQKTTTQDLPGSPRDEPPEQQSQQKIRCPIDLELDEETLASWHMNPGIPPDLARFAVRQWAAGQHADPNDRRHLGAWLKCAAKAVLGTWSDTPKAKALRAEFEASKRGPAERKRTQSDHAQHQARLAAQAEARKQARDAEVLAKYGPKARTPAKAAERPNPARARELARGIGRPD